MKCVGTAVCKRKCFKFAEAIGKPLTVHRLNSNSIIVAAAPAERGAILAS